MSSAGNYEGGRGHSFIYIYIYQAAAGANSAPECSSMKLRTTILAGGSGQNGRSELHNDHTYIRICFPKIGLKNVSVFEKRLASGQLGADSASWGNK